MAISLAAARQAVDRSRPFSQGTFPIILLTRIGPTGPHFVSTCIEVKAHQRRYKPCKSSFHLSTPST
ncbi:hypothetical protein V5799_027804 [Amblyomma americanum]|uniref:Uncharacterized protein n=1 Tax=Amblyomma americanum TaxID=6943 RepID=A0AAQ4DEP2_AMBAM